MPPRSSSLGDTNGASRPSSTGGASAQHRSIGQTEKEEASPPSDSRLTNTLGE